MTTLEGGILAEKGEWASLAKDLGAEKGISKQYKPPTDHVRHLKPLYVKVVINGRPISRAFINNGVLLNVSLFSTIKKLGKSK